ncbi:hypothetical protein BDZ94DRAFT_1312186 [Collybia nuda]|uniref:Uncharacterized protein n=1 Tax=Collybia nuda TaxID=64659 RepID=A0A9P5XZ13_9AGAR|nr:hypothetical protein BDZ94DRAFT_1312186 [Collybia nuda]
MLQEMNAQSQKVGNGGSQKEAYIVEPQERHWMSYSTYNGPPDVLNGQICVISTVLDAGAHTSFSGVRTLVVGEATGVLNKVRIQDWVGTPYHVQRYSHPSRSPRATVPPKPVKSSYQRSLAHHKHANERSSKLLKSNANIFPPLCTIILELADTSNKDWSSVSLALRYEGISNHNPLRVIYDHTVWFTPEQRSTISVLRLISEHSFNGFPKPTSTGLHLRPEGTPNHCIRILPLITHCSPPKLPSEVIQNIGYYVFEGADRNFRSLLLSFALLCKAWSPIVNIFWETLGTFSVNDKPDAKLVLKALSRQPEKARYVKRFIPWDYRILEGCNDKPYYHFSDIHLCILTMVTFVSEIHLCSIHLTIVESLLQLISTLPGIEIFIINDPISLSAADDPVTPPHGYYLNISDILIILPHWKKLRILHIEQCQATEPEQ